MARELPNATDRVRILDEKGRVLDEATVPDLSADALLEMYHDLKLTRRIDEVALNRSRRGQIGVYPTVKGNEGAQVGSAHALGSEDWVFPSHRELGVGLARGVEPADLLLYWTGHDDQNVAMAERNIFKLSSVVGAQIPQAMGMAWGATITGDDDRAYAAYFGDGATSTGGFHAGLNFAGVFETPTVFVCQNNQVAISVPRETQTASESLAAKAEAYGLAGVRVDGMDPLAVYSVMDDALERARDPDSDPRSTLIEAVQYQLGPYNTSVGAPGNETEIEEWEAYDPVPRLGAYLTREGILDDERIEAVEASVDEAAQAALDEAEAFESDIASTFEHTYANPPERVVEQHEELAAIREQYGDEAFRIVD
jgi:pyruvate dehydrogenase E1 component alpha subunit